MSRTAPPREGPFGPYRDALEAGRLDFQRCRACGNAWLPPRVQCPRCLKADYGWETSTGRGTIVSWVTFHRAYDPAFADLVPYDVILVALDDGPRLLSNLVSGEPVASRPVTAVFGREDGIALVRFAVA
jgi:uncharacterized OB-fold protein